MSSDSGDEGANINTRIYSIDRETPLEGDGNENDRSNDVASDPEKPGTETENGRPASQADDSSAKANSSADTCPICFLQCKVFVHGPCRHSLCVECMELVLNANSSVDRWPPPSKADAHLSAPTLGRCPICRSTLSLFDIVDRKTLKLLHPVDTESWRPRPRIENQRESDLHPHPQQQFPVGEVANEMLSSLAESLSSLTLSAEKRHPLENAVYVPYRHRPGEFSIHWDWERVRSHDPDNECFRRPFLNLTLAIRRRPEFWRLEDNSFARPIQFMEEGCHFHEPSRTFHGRITWPVPLQGSYEWDIILGFSKDYRCISTGRIHHKRGRVLKPGDVPKSYTNEERELCKHPMDGRWTVVWENWDGKEQRSEIRVSNNEFQQGGWPFFFNVSDPENIFAQWPRSPHRQTIVEGVDLTKHPKGPPAGHRIRWETSDPKAPDLVWIRQTVGPVPTEKVHHYGMGEDKFFYQRLDAELRDTIPKYHGDSVWGNVFTKRMCIGSASYHFVSPTESYISYRHPSCRDLPLMDDGSPLPDRVNFRNVAWDPEERKLTATVEWEQDFGTSWNDNVRWKLTMYFDTEFMVILKGGVGVEWCRERRARPRPPQPPPRNRPEPVPVYVPPPEEEQEETLQPDNRNEEWVVSGYGHDQLYVNAACLERYRPNRREDQEEVDYEALSEHHKKRLEDEGATKRTIGFLSHLFEHAAYDPNANPIDFLT